MKALFTYDYGEEKMNHIRELGYEVEYHNEREIETYKKAEDVDVLVCYNPFSKIDLKAFKNLKLIQLSSIGIDQVPKHDVEEIGITVCNNRGGYSIAIGEWIVLKALELMKNSKKLYRQQENKQWCMDTSLFEIYKKKIVFLGTGSIATEAAKRFQGFGAEIIGLNTRGRDVEYFDKCFAMSDMEMILPEGDIVIVSLPYTKETHHLLDKKALGYLKKSAYLINIARGNIIDENEMITCLKNGLIKGAALDVFEEEPLPKKNMLWDLDNVIITPHNCWISEMRNERRFDGIYSNLEHYIHDKDLDNVVDMKRGY